MVYGLDCTTNFIFGPWGTADSVSDATKREIVKEALNFGSSKSKIPILALHSDMLVPIVVSLLTSVV